MAKTIKFNLICDDKPVRTIEDIQENFSIEDVLKYYQNGLLLKWLKVRGYDDEYKKVSDIKEIEALEIVKELIKIFDVETDDKKVEEGVYMLQFLEERKELCEAYKQEDFRAKSIIDDYKTGYIQLTERILQNPNDVAIIKSSISELMNNYRWAMDLNYRALFWELLRRSKLAVMCLLMHEDARKYYLNQGKSSYLSQKFVEDNDEMYRAICSMIKSNEFLTEMGDNIYVYAGITDGYWKDLEAKGKKFMIISMESGDFVRSAGLQGGDLASTDIENKFVIVDGIDYKSNSASRQLLYMEV